MRSIGFIVVCTLFVSGCSIEKNLEAMGSKMDRIGTNLDRTNGQITRMADRLDFLVKALKKILEQIGGGEKDNGKMAQLETQKQVIMTEIESLALQMQKFQRAQRN